MKIGIFGGSFNPPHNMHESIAKELIEKHYVDRVIFVPASTKYEYKNNLLEDKIRYDLLKIITDKNPNFFVSTYEFQEELIYTYQTLDYYKEKYPKSEIYFICGLDNLSYLKDWKRGDYILENYKILVINRSGNNLKQIQEEIKKYQKNIILTDITPKEISSTEIRNFIKEEKLEEVKKYLDSDVLDYILKNNLYKEEII